MNPTSRDDAGTAVAGRPDIIARAAASTVRSQAKIARELGAYPYEFVLAHPGAPVAAAGGKGQITNFGSSNYLGLSTHPEVVAAAQEATRRYGTSTAGPRLFNGTLDLHVQIEEELADFYGKESAAIFQSGFTANMAMLSRLFGPDDVVIFDRDSHASQREGANSGRIRNLTFRHNDPASLRRRIAALPATTPFAVSLDGVFSMDGSLPPLPEIAAVTKDNGGTLLVDEAHGIGVMGPTGGGACEHFGCVDKVDLISLSLSKALAGSGGAVVGDRAAVEQIALTARSYIFTASCDPAAAGAALAALRLLRSTPELPAAVRRNGARLREVVAQAGWQAIPGVAPIVSIPVRNRISAVYAWRHLIEFGVYANVAIPPAVPEHGCVIRLVATAAHSDADFEKLYDALSATHEQMRRPYLFDLAVDAVGSGHA
ncbi:MAG TPA: pyridoxal phosphate-dependent aminotransferase family protein [Streptosporangiaceae bacterium]